MSVYFRILDRMTQYAVTRYAVELERCHVRIFLFFRILDRMMQYAVRGTRWNWSGVTGMVRDLQGHRSNLGHGVIRDTS